MNLSSVYTGITKDGVDRVLLKVKKNISLSKYCEVYIDLKSNEVFLEKEVCLDTLMPFKNISGNKLFMRKRKVIDTYDLDRNSMIMVENLRFGNVYHYGPIDDNFKDDFVLASNHRVFLNMTGSGRYVNKSHLFVMSKDKNNKIVYTDLVTNKKYYSGNNRKPKITSYVANTKKLENDFVIKGVELPKRLVLEMNYNKELY